jgi:hypothetical protein
VKAHMVREVFHGRHRKVGPVREALPKMATCASTSAQTGDASHLVSFDVDRVTLDTLREALPTWEIEVANVPP